MNVDLATSAVLFLLVALVGIGYAIKAVLHGASHFARVEQEGSSAFLNEGTMQAGYWALMPIGRGLVALGVPANAITLSSLALAGAAGTAIAFGHFGVGAALAAVGSLGDALDGLVARESRTASSAGQILDSVVDRYGEFLFLFGVAVFYREDVLGLSLALLALLGSFMVSYGSAKAEAMDVEAPRGSMRRPERAVYLTIGAALVPIAGAIRPDYAAAPILLALFIVAVVANGSAALRIRRIAELALERDDATAKSGRRLQSSPRRELAATRPELAQARLNEDTRRIGSAVR